MLIMVLIYNKLWLYSAHQKSGDRVTETVQLYVVITYTIVSELGKIMMWIFLHTVKLYINAQQTDVGIVKVYVMPDVSEIPETNMFSP